MTNHAQTSVKEQHINHDELSQGLLRVELVRCNFTFCML